MSATILCEMDGKLAELDRWKAFEYALAASALGDGGALWIVDPEGSLEKWEPHERQIELVFFDSMEEAIASWPDALVFTTHLQTRGDALEVFKHPDSALYVFGRDQGSGLRKSMAGDDREVSWIHIASTRDIYGFMAAGIVLYERARKRAPALGPSRLV